MICFLQAPVLRFALLPHYRRSKVERAFLRSVQLIFAFSNSTIEILEKGVEYVQS